MSLKQFIDYNNNNQDRYQASNSYFSSLPYYHYSIKREKGSDEKGTDTSEKSVEIEKQHDTSGCDKSTSTDGLLSDHLVGYYSKQQLLSSSGLLGKSTLINSYASITSEGPNGDSRLTSLPAIEIKNNEIVRRKARKPPVMSPSLEESFRIITSDLKPEGTIGTRLLVRHLLKPKKTSEWKLFNMTDEKKSQSASDDIVLKVTKEEPKKRNKSPLSVITTTLTTTTISTTNLLSNQTDDTSALVISQDETKNDNQLLEMNMC